MKDYSLPITVSLSKSGHNVPVVKGVYLHSIYDPIKEAEELTEQHENNLKVKSNILILGLGFGFHVEKVREKLQMHHGSNFKIYVVEPNSEIVELVKRDKLVSESKTKILCKKTFDEMFSDTEFVEFLLEKPTIITHSASFNLYRDFFKEFMSFEKHDSFQTNNSILVNENLKTMLLEEQEETSFSTSINHLLSRNEKESNDTFLLEIYKHFLS